MKSIPIFKFEFFFVLLLLVSCVGTAAEDETIRIGIESEPTSLDPRMAVDAYSAKVNELLYRGLFTTSDALELVPDLAQSMERKTPTLFHFTLKPNLFFHDGTPITSRDVLYTYRSILDPTRGSPLRSGFDKIKDLREVSDSEFEIELSEPYAPFLNRLTLGIVPAEAGARGDFSKRPIGSGPFRFVSWDKGQFLHLEAVAPTECCPVCDCTPSYAQVEFWFLPDENLRILELLHGRIDMVQNGISPILLPVVKKDPQIEIDEAPGINLAYLGFNLDHPILSSREVREAIAKSIDRAKLLLLALRGRGRLAEWPIPPENWAGLKDTPSGQTPYDPTEAKRLLDRAGFKDPDGDGPLPRFKLSYKTSVQKDRIEMALLIAGFLKEVGIDVSVESREWGTFFRDIQNGHFELYSLTWVGLTDPDVLTHMFHSKSVPPNGGNRGHYRNERVDRALMAARESYDVEFRKKRYEEALREVVGDFPYVLLWYEGNGLVRKKTICGYSLRPNASFRSLIDTYKGTCN